MSRPLRNLGKEFQTEGSTKALKGLRRPQGIAKKSVWPEWVRERMIGDEVNEHQRFNRCDPRGKI